MEGGVAARSPRCPPPRCPPPCCPSPLARVRPRSRLRPRFRPCFILCCSPCCSVSISICSYCENSLCVESLNSCWRLTSRRSLASTSLFFDRTTARFWTCKSESDRVSHRHRSPPKREVRPKTWGRRRRCWQVGRRWGWSWQWRWRWRWRWVSEGSLMCGFTRLD